VHSVQAALLSIRVQADTLHLDDEYSLILEKMRAVVTDYDVVILSGGVSKGKFDFLPAVLQELQVEKLFHRVAQRPGKPFWFGRQAALDTVVFALPGNPVSSFVGTHRYILPWLAACMEQQLPAAEYALLAADFTFRPALTYFLQVRLSMNEQAQILATPVTGNGSGDLANLADAEALLELPADRSDFQAGEVFPLIRFR
jgi:molybdopterin molybdotransferase